MNSDNIKRFIEVNSCVECPIIGDCAEWKKLTKQQRFIVTCGVGVNVSILKTCPLLDVDAIKALEVDDNE